MCATNTTRMTHFMFSGRAGGEGAMNPGERTPYARYKIVPVVGISHYGHNYCIVVSRVNDGDSRVIGSSFACLFSRATVAIANFRGGRAPRRIPAWEPLTALA